MRGLPVRAKILLAAVVLTNLAGNTLLSLGMRGSTGLTVLTHPTVLAGVVLLILVYFVGVEEGALSIFSGMKVHEFVHDARHLLGFPCH